MTAGDETEIGERGTTLSGGQKARVSLARALFSHKEIYLFDDVLASLDKKVGDKIFEQAIRDVLHSKTVVMVTTDPQRLALCDRVVFMDGGHIVAHGDHEELLATCVHYKDYCKMARSYEEYSSNVLDNSNLEGRISSSLDEDFEKENSLMMKKILVWHLCRFLLTSDFSFNVFLVAFSSRLFPCFRSYIHAAGSCAVWIFLLAAFVLNVAASIFSTFWLSRWLKKGHSEEIVEENGTLVLRSYGSIADSPDISYYSIIYGISLVILFVSGLVKAMIFVKVSLNAGSRLHNNMFSSVIRGAVSFFDTTPTGRILNRFSKDMDESINKRGYHFSNIVLFCVDPFTYMFF
uniref:ABC transmembrane type-1 domain-containing protein n=1 Tax=Heterorhabditis bacteriophora TaxID=37862 RepID=A0A1I7WQ35_HETBA